MDANRHERHPDVGNGDEAHFYGGIEISHDTDQAPVKRMEDELVIIKLWNDEDEDKQELLELEEGTGDIPSKFNCMKIEWTAMKPNDGKVARLLRLLNEDRQWVETTILLLAQSCGFIYPDAETRCEAISSVLGLIMLRTKALIIDPTCESVCRCLVSGLKSPHGIQDFTLTSDCPSGGDPAIRENDARLIAEGIATSTCLKSLHLEFRLETWSAIMTDGIKRNPKRLERLRINAPLTPLAFMNLEDYLNDKDCSLLHLELDDHHFRFEQIRNAKLQSLSIEIPFPSAKLHDSFPSLTTLKVGNSWVNDLSLFDPYLLGESATLRHFELQSYGIRATDARRFASKVSSMKKLRHLSLCGSGITGSAKTVTCLLGAVVKNKSLESFKLPVSTATKLREKVRPYQQKAMSQLWHNRMRREMENSTSVNLPSSIKLWPRILKRHMTMTVDDIYYDFDNVRDPGYLKAESIRRQADAVFRMIPDHAHIFDIIHG